MSLFSAEEEKRISEAITAAERKTSGEIVVVVAGRSDSYLYIPPLVAALVSLFVPWPLIYFSSFAAETVYLIQLAVFLVLTMILLPMPMRIALVPPDVKRRHAHRRALEQFQVQNLYTTKGHTGVLIFVSVAEHHVEILADAAIDAGVPAGTWDKTVSELADTIGKGRPAEGLITAIGTVGTHLAHAFPPETRNLNELPDHLIVLP